MLLSYLGVKDELFIKRNEQAIQFLDISKTLRRMSNKALDLRKSDGDISQEDLSELVRDMKLFFGPSRQFK